MFSKLLPLIGAAALLALASGSIPASASPTTPDARLLATYEPLLQFDPLEQFLPTRVQSFVTDADLELQTGPGTWDVVQDYAALGNLPDTGTWRLNERSCAPNTAVGGLTCYGAAASQETSGPTTYGHVVHESGDTVLEYWFFYYDDVYSYTYPPSDLFWQAHEGDW